LQKKANADIRRAMVLADVYHYQVMEALGISNGTFYKALRKELPADEKARWLAVIKEISEE